MYADGGTRKDYHNTLWMDVCPNNGNLLAVCGDDKEVKIFDKRVSTIVKTFENHESNARLPAILLTSKSYIYRSRYLCEMWKHSRKCLRKWRNKIAGLENWAHTL